MKAIVKAAHSERVKVTAHCERNWAIHAAIEPGVDGLEHGYGLKQSTLDTIAKRGIYLCISPKLVLPHFWWLSLFSNIVCPSDIPPYIFKPTFGK